MLVSNILPCVPDQTFYAGPMCLQLTACADGQYQSVPPANTSDRVCTEISTCPDGHRVVTAATATSDTVCGTNDDFLAAEVLSYWSTTTDNSTALEGDCGEQLTAAVTLIQDITPCVTGEIYRIGQMCVPLRKCRTSEYISQEQSDTTDRTCSPVSSCAAGQFVLAEATPTADTACGNVNDALAFETDDYWTTTADSRPMLEGDCPAQQTAAVALVQDMTPCIPDEIYRIGAVSLHWHFSMSIIIAFPPCSVPCPFVPEETAMIADVRAFDCVLPRTLHQSGTF